MTRIWLGIFALTFVGCDAKVVSKPVLSVERADPENGAHVSVGLPDCRIRFDRPLSPFSVSQSTIAVDPVVAFRTTLVDDGSGIRVMFSDWLAANTTHTLTISTDVMGVDRSRLAAPYSTTFVTGAPTRPVTIDTINPGSGSVGGGDDVTITGNGFEDPTSVLFGNMTAPQVTVVSATELTAVTPAGSRTGPVAVEVVRIADGASRILQDGFQYEPYPAPELTSMTPSTGPEAGGQLVTIHGSRLVAGSWAYFDDLPALAATTRSDAGQIVLDAITPPGTGQVDVIVRVPSGPINSSALLYDYVPAPVVAGATPNHGPATDVAPMPEIVITGDNFESGAIVTFDGVGATTTFVSATELRTTAVSGPSGSAVIEVENPDGQRTTISGIYFRDPPPRVASLSPTLGPITGGTPVDVHGVNFMLAGSPPEVLFGTTAAVQVQFVDATHLLAVTPSFPSGGPRAVTVTNPDGQTANLPGAFNALPPPTITTISPRAVGGHAQGWEWVTPMTVEGTGFVEGAVLYLDGRAAAATEVDGASNGTRLTAWLESSNGGGFSSPGFVTVRVVNPDGQVVEVPDAVYGVEFMYKNCVAGGGWNCDNMPSTSNARQIEWIKIQSDLPLGAVIANASITKRNQLAVSGPNFPSGHPFHTYPLNCDEIVYDDTAARFPDDTADETFSVAVDDIDGDGDEDILFGNQGQSRILLNNAGTFDYPGFDFDNSGLPQLGDTFRANDVELADITGEGRLDIVIAASESIDTNTNVVLINYGLPASPNMFVNESASRLPSATTSVWRDVEVADLNGDNHLDLVFVGATGRTEVWVNGQNGGNWGYFTLSSTAFPAGTIAASENLRGVALGDVTNDGDIDIVIAVSPGQNRLLAGNGDGTFTDATALLPTSNDDSRDVEIADINLDGHNDVVFANFDTYNRVYFYYPSEGRLFDVTEAPTAWGPSWSNIPGAESRTFMYRSVDWPTHDIDLRPYDGSTCASDNRHDMAVATNSFVHVGLTQHGCAALGSGGGALLTWIASFLLLMTWRRRRRVLMWLLAVVALGCVGQGCGDKQSTPCALIAVTEVYPPDSSWVSADTEIQITYERDIRLNGATLEVTNLTGGTVTGTVAVIGNTLTFTPNGDLPLGGQFEARVNGTIEDTRGCPAELAPAWRFAVPAAAQPTITELNPDSGPRFGGTRVDITGGGFVNGIEVHFGDNPAASVVLTNDTAITVVTPPSNIVGWVPVRLTAPGATPVELANAFEYFGIGVRIDQVSPASGPAAGGTAVTLTGVGFDEVTAVRFRDLAATIESQSGLQLVVTNPAGIGSVAITLDTADGGLLLPAAFTYVAAPVLQEIAPASGPLSQTTAGVVLTGVGLGDATSAPTVVVDGTDLAATAVQAHAADLTSVTFTMPAGSSAGAVAVSVRNPDDQPSPTTLDFTYVPAPEAPVATPPGSETSGGDLLVITCATADCAFLPGARVAFGSTCLAIPSSCTQADLVTSSQLATTSPASIAGRVDLFVINPDGQVSAAGDFYYFTRPTVTGVEPNWGPPTGGITVAVLGSGFLTAGTDEPVVFWDGQALPTQWISATELRTSAPAHPQGLVHRIEVRNPDYGSAGIDRAFTYRHVRLGVETEVGTGMDTPSGTVAFSAWGGTLVRLNGSSSEPIEIMGSNPLGFAHRALCNTPTISLPTGIALAGGSAYMISRATSPTLVAGRLRGYNSTNDPTDYGCPTTGGYGGTWVDEPDLVPTLSGAATDVVAGDVTGDGLVDIVVVNFDDLEESRLLLGTGTDFVAATPGPFAGQLEATLDVELADLDGDGALDILSANLSGDSLYRSNISTGEPLLDASFAPTIESSNAITTGDLDNDGDIDVVVASAAGLRVYRNDDGVALTEVDTWGYPTPSTEEAIAVTTLDADADGMLDVLVSWARTNIEYELYWGVGRGRVRLATADELDTSGLSLSDPAATFWTVDLSGDGDDDILIGTDVGADPLLLSSRNPAELVVESNDAFWLQPDRTGGSLLVSAAGDFDGDGADEVAIVASAWKSAVATIYRSAVLDIGGDGSLTPVAASPVASGFTGQHMAVAIAWNPDGDTDDDLLLVNDPSGAGATQIQIGWQIADSGLQAGILTPFTADDMQNPASIVAGDVDGAGRGVFFVATGGPQSRLLAYDTATYAAKLLTLVPAIGIMAADFADITGDAAEELIAVAFDGTVAVYTLAVDDAQDELLATEVTGILPTLGQTVSVVAADIDGDDDNDLLLGDILRVSLLENVDGSFALNPLRFAADRSYYVEALHTIDLDRDGDLDVLVRSGTTWKAFLAEGDSWFREETRQLTPHGDRWTNQRMVFAHPGAGGAPRIYSLHTGTSAYVWHHITLP